MIKQLTGSELDLQALLIKIAKSLSTFEYSYLSKSADFFSQSRDLESLFTSYLQHSLEVKSFNKAQEALSTDHNLSLKDLASYLAEEKLHLYDFERKDNLAVAQNFLQEALKKQGYKSKEDLDLENPEAQQELFQALLQSNLLERLVAYLDFEHLLPKFNNFIESSRSKVFFVSNSKLLQEAQSAYLKAFVNFRNSLIEDTLSSLTTEEKVDYEITEAALHVVLPYIKGSGTNLSEFRFIKSKEEGAISGYLEDLKLVFTNYYSILKQGGIKTKAVNVENFSRERLLGTSYATVENSVHTFYPESLAQSKTLLFIQSKDILANPTLALDIFRILHKGSYNYSDLAYHKHKKPIERPLETLYVDSKIVILGNSLEQEQVEELIAKAGLTTNEVDGVSCNLSQDVSFISELSTLERELAIEKLNSQINFLADNISAIKDSGYSFLPPLLKHNKKHERKELINNYFNHKSIQKLQDLLTPEQAIEFQKIAAEISIQGAKAIYGEASDSQDSTTQDSPVADRSNSITENLLLANQEELEALYTNYSPFFKAKTTDNEDALSASAQKGELTSKEDTSQEEVKSTNSTVSSKDKSKQDQARPKAIDSNNSTSSQAKRQELEKIFAPLEIFGEEDKDLESNKEESTSSSEDKTKNKQLTNLYQKTKSLLQPITKHNQVKENIAQESAPKDVSSTPTDNSQASTIGEEADSKALAINYLPKAEFFNKLATNKEQRVLNLISLVLDIQALNYLLLNKSYHKVVPSPSLDFIIMSIWLLLRENEDNQELRIKHALLSHYLDYCSATSYWNPSYLDFQKSILKNSDLSQLYDRENCRNNHYYQAEQKSILADIIRIATKGKAIGQVNGLACIDQEEYSKEDFGSIFRISSFILPEEGSVQDIDETIGMAGATAVRANLMTTNYIHSLFTENPSFSGVIVTEQLYDNTDGDSASITSFCALASALGNIPLKQSIAMTGSMDLQGNVLAVGGLNYKIDAFFQLCLQRGLTGKEGVIIPKANLNHLELDPLICQAIDQGLFNIYAIEHVSEAFEIVSDMRFVKTSDEEASKECKTLIHSSWPFIKAGASFIHTVSKEEEKSKNNLLQHIKSKFKALLGLEQNES